MRVRVIPKEKVKKPEIEAISSKSFLHRMLIGMALSGENSHIKVNILSEDMLATIGALKDLGYDIKVDNNTIYVNQTPPRILPDSPVEVFCKESGSTARFILPVAMAKYDNVILKGGEGLSKRPFGDLCDALESNGVSFESKSLPIIGKGKIKPGIFYLPGNVSSQYITGLLLALPLLEEDSKIMLTTELKSESYISITCEVLKLFGIEIKRTANCFEIIGNSKYKCPVESKCEGDWSNAAFPLCMGTLGNGVMLTNLNNSSVQGDRKIVDVLNDFGVKADIYKDSIKVSPGNISGCRVDLSDIPDMAPAISMLAMFAKGDTYLTNGERLRIKESDRVQGIESLLKAFGCGYEIYPDNNLTIVIKGQSFSKNRKDISIDSLGDHRLVMSACVASFGSKKEIIIENAEAVNKSYPGFFDDMSDFLDYEILN